VLPALRLRDRVNRDDGSYVRAAGRLRLVGDDNLDQNAPVRVWQGGGPIETLARWIVDITGDEVGVAQRLPDAGPLLALKVRPTPQNVIEPDHLAQDDRLPQRSRQRRTSAIVPDPAQL